MSTIFCMARDTGLCDAKSCPANSASNTGLVIRCCESMLIASSGVIESLRLSRSPARNCSNAAAAVASAPPSRAWIRVVSVAAMSATSAAHCSQ
ncbi:Uncharacterised protein [Mycobacterium tuberculosis]|uniref:Uncharacterized protein n=1 Tax=Mycobacterium tuberculosis TaxID=1773 RepID=A0A655ATS9_MYCTX|nr:Uncharacterised protein [Mycobacterium tuberculosis]CKP52508.1 Uncharacterised protein [Mycobacterium tuberculosis]CKR26421.1 Uncharacterised protein [Mycobacterium tuberculosis]CKS75897.1 Uncharacterised protein [Mycobacterium tuberculosis]CKU27858.1 Uncharacterised protein [Mycobacterium tuberculosis]